MVKFKTSKLVFHIFGSLAKFERDLIKERTTSGLSTSQARGITARQPNKLGLGKMEIFKKMYKDKTIPIKQILETIKISKDILNKRVR